MEIDKRIYLILNNNMKSVKSILGTVLLENITEKILQCSITKNNIKDIIFDEIYEFMREFKTYFNMLPYITPNCNLTMENVKKHEWVWETENFYWNPNLMIDMITKNIEKIPQRCWNIIFRNKDVKNNITIELLDKAKLNFCKYIDVYVLCKNFHIGLIYERDTDDDIDLYEIGYDVSKHPNTKMEDIEKYPDFSWDWYGVSENPNLTLETVYKNPSTMWCWREISKNSAITLEIIDDFPEKLWDWKFGISKNPNITIDFVEKHIDKSWDFCEIEKRFPGIIKKFPEKNYSSDEKYVPPNIIKKNKIIKDLRRFEYKCDLKKLRMYKKDMTIDFIRKHYVEIVDDIQMYKYTGQLRMLYAHKSDEICENIIFNIFEV